MRVQGWITSDAVEKVKVKTDGVVLVHSLYADLVLDHQVGEALTVDQDDPAKLATAGAPITAVVNYYGTDAQTFAGFYVRADSPITKPSDLVGKKIGVNTLGGNLEADVHERLKKDGLTAEQIKAVQLVPLPPPNTEDALRKGQIDVAALSGQFQQKAVAVGGVRAVFTDFDLFGAYNGGQYVVRNDLIKKTPRRSPHSPTELPRPSNGSAPHPGTRSLPSSPRSSMPGIARMRRRRP